MLPAHVRVIVHVTFAGNLALFHILHIFDKKNCDKVTPFSYCFQVLGPSCSSLAKVSRARGGGGDLDSSVCLYLAWVIECIMVLW